MRHRKDNALEVCLETPSSGLRLVGWLTDARMSRHMYLGSTYRVRQITFDEYGEAIDDERSFPYGRLRWELDMSRLSGSPIAMIEKNTPRYATEDVDVARDMSIYTWPVLKLTSLDDYEWLFDHSAFEPFDEGPPDVETRKICADLARGILEEKGEDLLKELAGTGKTMGAVSAMTAHRRGKSMLGSMIAEGTIRADKLKTSEIKGVSATTIVVDECESLDAAAVEEVKRRALEAELEIKKREMEEHARAAAAFYSGVLRPRLTVAIKNEDKPLSKELAGRTFGLSGLKDLLRLKTKPVINEGVA